MFEKFSPLIINTGPLPPIHSQNGSCDSPYPRNARPARSCIPTLYHACPDDVIWMDDRGQVMDIPWEGWVHHVMRAANYSPRGSDFQNSFGNVPSFVVQGTIPETGVLVLSVVFPGDAADHNDMLFPGCWIETSTNNNVSTARTVLTCEGTFEDSQPYASTVFIRPGHQGVSSWFVPFTRVSGAKTYPSLVRVSRGLEVVDPEIAFTAVTTPETTPAIEFIQFPASLYAPQRDFVLTVRGAPGMVVTLELLSIVSAFWDPAMAMVASASGCPERCGECRGGG
jgi:hypothetical protein